MIEIIDITDSERWDAVVTSFAQYDVYYLSGYVKGFKLHGDGEPELMYYDSESLRAIRRSASAILQGKCLNFASLRMRTGKPTNR